MTNEINLIGIHGKMNSGKDEVAKIIQYLTSDSSIKGYSSYRIYQQFLENRNRNPSLPDSWYISEWENKKFSGKLKQIASLILGEPVWKFEDRDFKNSPLPLSWNVRFKTTARFFMASKEVFDSLPMTVREFLQKLGNGIREAVHPDFWVNALFVDWVPSIYEASEMDIKEGKDAYEIIYPKWVISDLRYLNEIEKIKSVAGVVIKVIRNTSSEDSHISETELDDFEDWDYIINNNGSIEDLINQVKDMLSQFKIKHNG